MTNQEPGPHPAARERDDGVITVSKRTGHVAYVASYAPTGGTARLLELRATVDVDGDGALTVEALRAAPLAELQKLANKAVEASSALGGLGDLVADWPRRFSGEADYRRLLALVEALTAAGDRAPLQSAARMTDTPVNTLAARLRTARKTMNKGE